MSHLIGSIEEAKLADLVLWEPAFFGTKPDKVLKGGTIVWSQMGDANASIPTPQPVMGRMMFGARSGAIHGHDTKYPNCRPTCVSFVSNKSCQNNIKERYGLKKRIEAVKNCSRVQKTDMKLNDHLPEITVDPETYQVTVNGELLKVAPADSVPLSRAYYMF